MTEERLIEILGTPVIDHVKHRDGNSLGSEIPEYIVKSAFDWPNPLNLVGTQSIKIIDFGGSFLCTTSHQTIHTPLAVRPPEVIFQDQIIGHRVDLWSMGCMVGEAIRRTPLPWKMVGELIEIMTALRAFHRPASFRYPFHDAKNTNWPNGRNCK